MKYTIENLRRLGLIAGLTLTTAAILAACSSTPERVEKSLEQTTATRQSIASVALSRIGDDYANHMAGPKQFDDAGLAYYAYRQNGRKLPRSLADQLDAGHPIPLAKAHPGDLAFFRLDSPDGHGRLSVGILIDAHLVVIAVPGNQTEDGGVKRVSLSDNYWSQRLVGVSHILPDTSKKANGTS